MLEEFAFIGHDYFGGDIAAKSTYRTVIKAAFNEINRQYLLPHSRSFAPIYGDTTQAERPTLFDSLFKQNLFRPGDGYGVKIRGKISVTTFAIFKIGFIF